MSLIIEEIDFAKFILIGDKVLIRPKNPKCKTESGLYIPPNEEKSDKTASGYVVTVGPGYTIPAIADPDEIWKEKKDELQHVPLQAQAGDLAVYLNKSGWDIEFNKEKFLIVPHSAILLLIRDEGLFE